MTKIVPSKRLEDIVAKFNHDQLSLIMENIGCLQLTEGCNSACPDCGVGAPAGVRDYISFDLLKWLFTEFKEELISGYNKLAMYYASDPFDYSDGKNTYVDVHKMFERIVGYNPTVITNMPPGKEKEIWKYIFDGNKRPNRYNSFLISAISLTNLNEKRVINGLKEILPELSDPNKQIIVKSEYKLRSCYESKIVYDEGISFQSGRKKWILMNLDEIVDTTGIEDPNRVYLDGVNKITLLKKDMKIVKRDETNCRYRYVEKYGHIPENNEIWNKIRLKEEKQRKWIDKFIPKYLSKSTGSGIRRDGQGKLHLLEMPNGDYIASEGKALDFTDVMKYLLFNQLEVNRSDAKNPGVTIRDYRDPKDKSNIHTNKVGKQNIGNLSEYGIGCYHGTLLTPSGFYNLQTRKPTRVYPYGQKYTLITPENFKVAKFYRVRDSKKESRKYKLLSV